MLCCTVILAVGCAGGENKQETTMANDECLICGAPLEYLTQDTMMECVLCHKQEPSKTRCSNGHYVCNDCHTKGMDSIIVMCLQETSRNPIEILEKMMSKPFCHMHGPEHHVLVGAALLTAYNNCLPDTAKLNTPLSTDTWRLCNLCTARALEQVALNGGPRCCKRDSYLSILSAVDFVKENLGVEMERTDVTCSRSQINNQCIGRKCPFSPEH